MKTLMKLRHCIYIQSMIQTFQKLKVKFSSSEPSLSFNYSISKNTINIQITGNEKKSGRL